MGTQSPGSAVRTKHMLSEALLRLVEKRSFRKISVGDICQEAMVSRSAFYSHFEDKYELLSFSLSETLRRRADAGRSQTLEEQFVDILTGVQENRRTLHNVFMADLSPELMDIFQKTLAATTAERLLEHQKTGGMLPGNVSFIAAFLAGGMANVILGWIRENCATPIEEVARCQCELIKQLIPDI